MNSYEELESIIKALKYIDLSNTPIEIKERNSKKLLEELLKRISPLIISRAKHYFGYVNQDLIQDGILRSIQLITGYDLDKNKSFAAYMKYMLSAFFWDLKRKELLMKQREEIKEINPEGNQMKYIEEDYEKTHIKDLISCLDEKEQTLVKRHILGGLNLKSTCESMDISYRQGRYILKKSIEKLKKGYTKTI